MINTDYLRAKFILNHKTQEEVAREIGISTKSMSLKMNSGEFKASEIEKMAYVLHIPDPGILFAGLTPEPEEQDEPVTVTALIARATNAICDGYCKWPEKYEGNEDIDALMNEKCRNCPLNLLQ